MAQNTKFTAPTVNTILGKNTGWKKGAAFHSPGYVASQSPLEDISRGIIVTQIKPQERQTKLPYSSFSPKKVEKRRHTTSDVPDMMALHKIKVHTAQLNEKLAPGLEHTNHEALKMEILKKNEDAHSIEENENEDKQQEYKENSHEPSDFEKCEKESKIIKYLDELGLRQAIPAEKEKEYYDQNKKNIPYRQRDSQLLKNRKNLVAPMQLHSLSISAHFASQVKEPEGPVKEIEEAKFD